MISVVILTLNEAQNLPRCLASLSQCDDIVVLDSGSTDRTVDIAHEHGARVFTHAYGGDAAQHNYAHTNIDFRHSWLLHLDADEEMTPELWAECYAAAVHEQTVENSIQSSVGTTSTAAHASLHDGFFISPKMIFQGRWIPHCTDYPCYQPRFGHVRRFRFIKFGHSYREAPSMHMGTLRENYLHHFFTRGEAHWLAKHRRYAAGEVATHLAQRRSAPPPRLRDLFSRDKLTRRRTLQRFAFHFPFRPQLRFVYQYILRRGFLDGLPGLRYCRLLMHYERFIVEALREAKTKS